MLHIFASDIEKMSIMEEYNDLLSLLSPERKIQVLTHGKSPKKVIETLAGEKLTREILIKKYNCPPGEKLIFLDNFKKPYCPLLSQSFFNISHSDRWVVVAFSIVPIGIDLQKIKQIPEKIMNQIVIRFFSSSEKIQYFNLDRPMRKKFFFTLWTIKESFIKLHGAGLTIPLHDFSATFSTQSDGILYRDGSVYFFHTYIVENNYILSVCSHDNIFPPVIEKIVGKNREKNSIVTRQSNNFSQTA
jgi:4'-phosphopantetheinyl transferase